MGTGGALAVMPPYLNTQPNNLFGLTMGINHIEARKPHASFVVYTTEQNKDGILNTLVALG